MYCSLLLQVLALLAHSYKCQYPQVALSNWEWALRWEMDRQGEVLVDLLEFLALSQEAGVAMEVALCPWPAGVMVAEEATMTWMLLKISVVYSIMAICSLVCVFCVWCRHNPMMSHVSHHAEVVQQHLLRCESGPALIQQMLGTQHKHCHASNGSRFVCTAFSIDTHYVSVTALAVNV